MIADISGYTEFMVSSATEIEHSQYIISQLIHTLIEQVELPMEVSKLEGDAVFLYAIKDDRHLNRDEVSRKIGEKLIRFFEAFHDKIIELGGNKTSAHDTCACGACSNIRILKLKLVVHSGTAHFYQIHEFNELSGSDVILVHRLLKNSVTHEEYILMTEPAWADIHFQHEVPVEAGCEHYEHLGDIKTLVYNHA
ncbi:MAG: DUF2652 domain-containing protein [Pseudomonadota bacterium]